MQGRPVSLPPLPQQAINILPQKQTPALQPIFAQQPSIVPKQQKVQPGTNQQQQITQPVHKVDR